MSEAAIQKNENQSASPERMEQTTYFTPLVDIMETDDSFIFNADVPGVRPEDTDISYDNGVLTLIARAKPRQPEDVRYLWKEYDVGPFYRQFVIDTSINPDGIRAELKNGELSLTVPKSEAAKEHKIQIKGA